MQRNSGHVFRVQQMLDPIEYRRNAHEESRKGCPCHRRLRGRRRSRPSAPRRHRESESAAAEGELSQRQGPSESVVGVRSDGWHVHDENEERTSSSPTRAAANRAWMRTAIAERRAKKSEAYQIDPKQMRGNPAWNEGRNTRRGGEMLGAKNGHRNRKKQSAKRHDLVDAVFLRQFIEYFDDADEEEQRRRHVNPEYRRRHAKRRQSQSSCDDSEPLETAHEDLHAGFPQQLASFLRGSGQLPSWRARNRSRVMERELAEDALVPFFVHRKEPCDHRRRG